MRRRQVAWGLIAYGVLGLALVVSGAILGLDAAQRIERLAGAANGTLDAAARSTRAAADSFTGIDGSLAQARASADNAATLSREAGATLDSLAVAMSINVLGTQPLAPLADDFSASADQAGELADTLDRLGASLGDSRADVAVIGVELDTLSDELESLGSAGSAEGQDPPLRLFVVLLLAWVTIPAVGAIVVGLGMLRTAAGAAA